MSRKHKKKKETKENIRIKFKLKNIDQTKKYFIEKIEQTNW